MALLFASRSQEVDAVVAYHPGVVAAAEVARLKAPVLFHHGTADRAVDAAETKKLETVLKAQKTPVELFLYEGADHGFLAYTRPPRYHPQAELLLSRFDSGMRILHRDGRYQQIIERWQTRNATP